MIFHGTPGKTGYPKYMNCANVYKIDFRLLRNLLQLTAWDRVLEELVKKCPAFYGNRKYITMLTRARH